MPNELLIARARLLLRVLFGFVALYAAIWVIRVIMGVGPNLLLKHFAASPNVRAFLGSTLNYGVGITAYLFLPAMALRWLAKNRSSGSFFPFLQGWLAAVAFGFLLESGLLALLFFVETKLGWLVVDNWMWRISAPDTFVRTAWVGLLVNLGVAIGEETVFRGYLLTGLKAALGKWGALALMMILFGLFHLPAYLASGLQSAGLWLALVLATLLGGLFGLIYLRTETLWLPAVLHFTWNLVENDLLNLSADRTNPNLIGAITRLRPPLTMNGLAFTNQIILESLVALVLALGIWLWLRKAPPTFQVEGQLLPASEQQ